jgi:PAS domain S-box-containing protein
LEHTIDGFCGDEEPYRLLFEKSPQPMYVLDAQTLGFLAVNDAALHHYGYAREEFLKLRLRDIGSPEDEPCFVQATQMASSGYPPSGRCETVWKQRTKDGNLIELEIRASRMALQGREVVLVLANNVTERSRAEARLRESSQALAALIRASPLSIITLDREGAVTSWNPAAERIFGWREEEVLGQPLPVVPADQRAQFDAYRDAELRGETRNGVEVRRQRKDGSLIDVNIWTAPVKDANGIVQSTFGIVADISERKRAEEKLQESHNLLNAVIEGISQAIYVKDIRGRYLMMNSAGARLVGKPSADIVGRDDIALFGPATARQFRQADRRIMETGQTETYEDSATLGGVTRTYITTKAPYRGPHGEILGVVGTSGDISERKNAEEALRTTQEFLSRLLENIPAVVYVNSSNGCMRLVNRAWEECFGMPRERALGLRKDKVFSPELATRFLASDQQVLRASVPVVFEERLEIQGRARWFHTVKFPLRDATGRFDAVGGISIDITDRRLAEEAARDSSERLQILSHRLVRVQEEERRHLARELHDEIGQILTAVFYNLQALKGSCGMAVLPGLDDTVAIVDRAIQQVRSLSLDLRPPMLDDLGLAAAIKWYVEEQARRTGLKAQLVAPPSAVMLPPEAQSSCFRVVQEALTNVVRHARARHVWLELRQQDNGLDLTIRDDGVGFDAAAARQGAACGRSFGLLGMQERVEMLGGRITIESETGRGTTLRVWFPLYTP